MMGIVEHCFHDLNLGSGRARNWCFIINMMIIRTELHIQTQSSCCNLHSLGFSFSSLISDFWHKHVVNNMSDTGVGIWFISAWWDWCFSLFLKETCLHMFPVLIFTCPVIMWQKAWANTGSEWERGTRGGALRYLHTMELSGKQSKQRCVCFKFSAVAKPPTSDMKPESKAPLWFEKPV